MLLGILRASCAAACLLLSGCITDVTSSPEFRDVVGKCFATKQDLFLRYNINDKFYSIPTPPGPDHYRTEPGSVEEFRSNPERFPQRPDENEFILAVLPAGTRIKATKLTRNPVNGFAIIDGVIMSGAYDGKAATIWELFDAPDFPGSPTAKTGLIEPKPLLLDLVDCGKKPID